MSRLKATRGPVRLVASLSILSVVTLVVFLFSTLGTRPDVPAELRPVYFSAGATHLQPRDFTILDEVRVQIVTSAPAAGHFSMYTLVLLAAEGARRAIHITNPYFVPDERMTEALLRALGRGVRVVVLLPATTDWNLVRMVSRRTLGPLLQAGVEVHEYTAAMLHAKSMVVDGVWATVGSTNFDNRSFALNAELNAVFYDAGIAARLDRVFMDALARSRPVSLAEWAGRPLWHRLLELLAWPIRHQL